MQLAKIGVSSAAIFSLVLLTGFADAVWKWLTLHSFILAVVIVALVVYMVWATKTKTFKKLVRMEKNALGTERS